MFQISPDYCSRPRRNLRQCLYRFWEANKVYYGKWAILFRYAPHYGIIMHTSYLPTGQRSRLKEVIQRQISSDINPRRRRNNQFFLSCFTRSASSFLFIRFTFLVLVRFLKGCSLFVYSHLFFSSLYPFFLASVADLALDSRQQEFRLPTW